MIKGENENECNASYKVNYQSVHSGDAHMTAENPIISCTEDIVSCMPSDIIWRLLKEAQLSNSSFKKNQGRVVQYQMWMD